MPAAQYVLPLPYIIQVSPEMEPFDFAESCASSPKFDNGIVFLKSDPLASKCIDGQRMAPPRPLAQDEELNLLERSLMNAGRDIKLYADVATYHGLQAGALRNYSCLHFSGHGERGNLAIEQNGFIKVVSCAEFVGSIRLGRNVAYKLAVVLACSSLDCGHALIDAGVEYVVCTDQSEILDYAVLQFVPAFYLSLARGWSLQAAFDSARSAVRTSNIPRAADVAEKFKLLPERVNHDVIIFDSAKEIREWPQSDRGSLLERNVIQARALPPSPPEMLLGRHEELMEGVYALRSMGLVSLVGQPGCGRASVARKIGHHINERPSEFAKIRRICFAQVMEGGRSNALVRRLLRLLLPEAARSGTFGEMEEEDAIHELRQALVDTPTLLILSYLENLADVDAFRNGLRFLATSAPVLVTSETPLGRRTGEERVINVRPLDAHSTIQLFWSCLVSVWVSGAAVPVNPENIAELKARLLDHPLTLPTKERISGLIGAGIPREIAVAALNFSPNLYQRLMRASWDPVTMDAEVFL